MSNDPQQEYLVDGLTEEIINTLSKFPQVFVIARNSSFTYKGKNLNVKQVGQEMGVQYVLEGSVRREANRIRITAQLIDSSTGVHIFSERYDRQMKDIFAMQDDIAIRILTALRVALKDGEWAKFHARGVKIVEAYFKLLEASNFHQRVNKESNEQARRLADEALALDPGSSAAYTTLAFSHLLDYWLGSPEESTNQGIRLAKKAISLDDNPRTRELTAFWDCCMRIRRITTRLWRKESGPHPEIPHPLSLTEAFSCTRADTLKPLTHFTKFSA